MARQKNRSTTRKKRVLIAALLAWGLAFGLFSPLAANAAAAANRSGALPEPGKIVIRSGLAWMDETSPAFKEVAEAAAKELTALGFTVVPPAKPTALDPMPKTPFQQSVDRKANNPSRPSARGPSVSDDAAKEKASALAKEGKLPKLRLDTYDTPQRDADLPQTVKDVRPPDVTEALYARSQEQGKPTVRHFAIPGKVPAELAADAAYADYALVIRFAALRSWSAGPENFPEHFMGLPGVLVAAATIQGTGALGFGPPASPSSTAPPNTYGTSGGFMRGYEGNAPNDFWGRDRDFFQRDYMFKHGEQPQYATPPKDLSPGMRQPPAMRPEMPDGDAVKLRIEEWVLVFADCYDLAPARGGKEPVLVWSGSARQPAQREPFARGAATLVKSVLTTGKAAKAR